MRCWVTARVSRPNALHDHCDARRFAAPPDELSPRFPDCGDEFRASLLGDLPAERIGEFLLLLKGEPVGCIQGGRVRSMTEI
jgi:hypothetical protein